MRPLVTISYRHECYGGSKNPQHAFLRRGSKRICPMSQLAACQRT